MCAHTHTVLHTEVVGSIAELSFDLLMKQRFESGLQVKVLKKKKLFVKTEFYSDILKQSRELNTLLQTIR